MALVSYALASISELAVQLGTDSSEYQTLEHLINAATERIEREAGRRFAATDYVEWIDANGQDRIVLDQYPIIRVQSVGIGRCPRLSIAYSGAGVTASVIVTEDNLRLLSIASDGTNSTEDITLNGTTTISEVEAAIDAVSGWSATTVGDGPSLHLMPGTVGLKSGDTVYVEGPDDWTYPAATHAKTGEVMLDQATWLSLRGDWHQGDFLGALRPWDSAGYGGHRIMVQYRAGYETIPADINQLAREFAAQMYYGIGQDPSIQSESLGTYSRTLASRMQVTDGMRAVLSRYTREIIA